MATTVRPIWTVRKKEEDPQIQFPIDTWASMWKQNDRCRCSRRCKDRCLYTGKLCLRGTFGNTGVPGSVKREFAVIMSFGCSALSVRQLVRVLGLWESAGCIQVSRLKASLAISLQDVVFLQVPGVDLGRTTDSVLRQSLVLNTNSPRLFHFGPHGKTELCVSRGEST